MLILALFQLFLGLILFFLGMNVVKESFYKAAGYRLELVLRTLTTNILTSILTGMVVTMLIQSSSATTVIIISLVNANFLSLEQAVGVIMGANIGTTITVQLISFKLEEYLWIIIILGLVLYLLYYITKNKNIKYIARGLMGFSILFIGLELLSKIITSLQNIEGFIELLNSLADQPLLAIIIGIIITALIQSSSALTGVTVILARAKLIDLTSAISLALGSNIGTCITAIIAAVGSSQASKKTAWAHTLFNLVGVLVILPLLPLFIRLIALTSNKLPRQIANAHTIFNIFNTVIILMIKDKFIKFVDRIN